MANKVGSYKVAISPDLSGFAAVGRTIASTLTKGISDAAKAMTAVERGATSIGKVSFSGLTAGAEGAVRAAAGIGTALTTATRVSFAPVGASINGLVSVASSVAGQIQTVLTGAVMASGAALASQLPSAIEQSDALDDFRSEMQFVTQQGLQNLNDAGITKIQQQMVDFAGATEYNLDDVIAAVSTFAANGRKDYMQLAEQAAQFNSAAGGTSDTFHQLEYVLGQAAGQGKILTGDWNQIINALPGGAGALQKALKEAGAYTGDFRTALSQSQISADELFSAIEQLGGTEVAVRAAKSSATIRGAWANTTADFQTAIAQIITANKSLVTDFINGSFHQFGLAAIGTLNSVVEFLKSFASGGSGWQQQLNNLANGMSAGFGKATSAIQGFLPRLRALASGIVGIIAAAINGIADNMPAISSIFSTVIQDILSWGQKIIPAVEHLITSIMSAIATQLPRILDSGISIGEQLLPGIVSTIGDVITTLYRVIYNALPKIASLLADVARQLADEAVKDVPIILNAIVSGTEAALPILLSAVADIAPKLIQLLSESLVTITQWIATVGPQIATALEGVANEAAASFQAVFPQIIATLVNGASSIAPGIISTVGNLITTLYTTLSAQIPRIAQLVSTILQNVATEVAKDLPVILTSIINGITGAMPTIVRTIETLTPQILATIQTLLDRLVAGADTMLPQLLSMLVTITQEVVQALPEIMTTIVMALISMAPQLGQAIAAMITSASMMLMQNADAIANTIVTLIDTVIQTLAPVAGSIMTQLIPALWTGLQTVVSALFSMLPSQIQASMSSLGSIDWSGIFGTLMSAAATIMGQIGTIIAGLQPVFEAIAANMQPIADGFAAIGEAIVQLIIDNMPTINEALTTVINAFGSLMEWLSQNKQAAEALVGTVLTLVAAYNIFTTVSAIVKGFSAVMTILRSSTLLTTAAQWLLNIALTANPIGIVIVAIGALVAALTLWFTQTDTGRKQWSAFMDWLNNAWIALGNAWNSMINGIGAAWNGMWSGIGSFFHGIWDGVVGAISDGITSIGQVFQNLSSIGQQAWGVVTRAFEGAGNWLKNAGEMLVKGLESGMQKEWNRFTGFLWKFAKDTTSVIQHGFQIGSPSRVMADQVGRWIPAGIGVGIENYSSGLIRQASALASTLTDTLQINPTSTWSLDDQASAQAARLAAQGLSTNLAFGSASNAQQPQVVINQEVSKADSLADIYRQTQLASKGYFTRGLVAA